MEKKSVNKMVNRKFTIDDKGRIVETMEFPKFMLVHTKESINELKEMLNNLD